MTTKIDLDHLEAAAQVGMNLSSGLGVPHLVKVTPEVLAELIAQIRERDRLTQSVIELGHRVSVLEAELARTRPVVHGDIDLSVFLGNCAVAGALERARTVGVLHAIACAFPEANQALVWHPNTEGVAAP